MENGNNAMMRQGPGGTNPQEMDDDMMDTGMMAGGQYRGRGDSDEDDDDSERN